MENRKIEKCSNRSVHGNPRGRETLPALRFCRSRKFPNPSRTFPALSFLDRGSPPLSLVRACCPPRDLSGSQFFSIAEVLPSLLLLFSVPRGTFPALSFSRSGTSSPLSRFCFRSVAGPFQLSVFLMTSPIASNRSQGIDM